MVTLIECYFNEIPFPDSRVRYLTSSALYLPFMYEYINLTLIYLMLKNIKVNNYMQSSIKLEPSICYKITCVNIIAAT